MSDVLRSGPFVSVNGDRAYLDSFFRDYFATFINTGVFINPSDSLQVIADDGLNVIVRKGNAWIKGAAHLPETDEMLTLETGDRLGRIDKIVLRMDTIQRTITKEVKKGVPATSAVAPSLQRDEDAYELGLAEITVPGGGTAITQSSIKDLRHDKEQCGIVHGLIEQVDTTTLFNEYQAWISEKKVEYDADLVDYTETKKVEWEQWFNLTSSQLESEWNSWFQATSANLQSEWDAWFAAIKTDLDGDTAGNLLNKINAIPHIYSGAAEPSEATVGDYWLKEV